MAAVGAPTRLADAKRAMKEEGRPQPRKVNGTASEIGISQMCGARLSPVQGYDLQRHPLGSTPTGSTTKI